MSSLADKILNGLADITAGITAITNLLTPVIVDGAFQSRIVNTTDDPVLAGMLAQNDITRNWDYIKVDPTTGYLLTQPNFTVENAIEVKNTTNPLYVCIGASNTIPSGLDGYAQYHATQVEQSSDVFLDVLNHSYAPVPHPGWYPILPVLAQAVDTVQYKADATLSLGGYYAANLSATSALDGPTSSTVYAITSGGETKDAALLVKTE